MKFFCFVYWVDKFFMNGKHDYFNINCLLPLQGNEARVYEFIVRHFLACVSQDALGQETVVDIDIAQEKFSTSGLMIIARNYLDVYPYDKWNAKVQTDRTLDSSLQVS